MLFGVGFVLGAQAAGLAQVLAEAADGLLTAIVLLKTTRLIEDEIGVLGIDEKIRQDLDALGVVAGQAGLPGRALLGFLARRVRERREQQEQYGC